MKMNPRPPLSRRRASHRFLWTAGLAAIWLLVDYPVGLRLFDLGALAHGITRIHRDSVGWIGATPPGHWAVSLVAELLDPAIVIRSSSPSCATSTPMCRPNSTSNVSEFPGQNTSNDPSVIDSSHVGHRSHVRLLAPNLTLRIAALEAGFHSTGPHRQGLRPEHYRPSPRQTLN